MRKLTPEIHTAVKEIIRDNLRYEALEILFLTTEKERQNFLDEYKNDRGNICCLILDYAKKDLEKRGVLKIKEGDGFGIFPF
jgi:hypothetical protein